jgi:hypothetical protein
MHKNIPTILVISLLIPLIICCACVSKSSTDQTPQQNGGLKQIFGPEESPNINFNMALQDLRGYQPDSTNDSNSIQTIYLIHGTNVDRWGNATSWIFGVRHSAGTEMLAYDRSGWIKIPWNAPQLSEEIDVDRIVSPSRLFNQNDALIQSNPTQTISERRDLDLQGGIYTITITSGSTVRILRFNATTGVLNT